MKIEITDAAFRWFEEEMDIKDGDFIRFHARYGGNSPLQAGFSLGLSKEEPMDPAVTCERCGCTFFIEERDIWYFDGHNLIVEYDKITDGPEYRYEKEEK